jgi:hypothetical protein
MFSKNEKHRQQSFFSGVYLLLERLQHKLLSSWAETLYRKGFRRSDEEIFAPLYE